MGSMFRLVSRRDAAVGLALLLAGIEAFKLPAAPRLRPSLLAMSGAFPSLPPAGENRGASGGSDDGAAPVLTTRFRRSMQLSFTCNMCETRNKKMINRDAYYNGIVVVRCDGCSVNHLIADNLDWVEPGFGTLEDWAGRQENQKIRKFTDEDGFEATWISTVDGPPRDDIDA